MPEVARSVTPPTNVGTTMFSQSEMLSIWGKRLRKSSSERSSSAQAVARAALAGG